MAVISRELSLRTKREGEIIDITGMAQDALRESGLKNGIMVLFVPGSTASITTIEFEPGLKKDLPEALDRIAPEDHEYHHEQMWHDGNGRSHVKASMMKPDLTVPFNDGELITGTWQQIVFVELDVRPRNSTVILQIIGE